MSVAIAATKVPVRTRGDGHWKKYTYQDVAFSITLSGLLKFDDANFTGWDMLDNQFNFSDILMRCTFLDELGNIRTVQGNVMVETSTLSYSPGTLVKEDFQLQGNGKLDMFDGYIPCDAVVTGYSTTGTTTSGGNVVITYTYTGAAYQVKYRLDGAGDYTYVLATHTINLTLAIGVYDLEIIPVCINGYEGTGFAAPFFVTQGQVCGTVISNITIDSGVTSAVAVYTGTATQMKYRVDGGAWITASITSIVSLTGLSIGAHTIEMVPTCANAVEGTGFVKSFSVTSQPGQSVVNYDFRFPDEPNFIAFNVYVNGVLTISTGTTASGMITVSTGKTVKYEMIVGAGRNGIMTTTDDTTATTLNNQGGSSSFNTTFSYNFTANGDEFSLDGQINDI